MKYLFIDMDGTIADYWHKSGKCDIKEFDKGMFITKRPVKIVIDAIKTLFPERDYMYLIISIVPHEDGIVEKNDWLDKYFNIEKDRRVFLQFPNSDKVYYIYKWCEVNNIKPEDVIFIDDHHDVLKKTRRMC